MSQEVIAKPYSGAREIIEIVDEMLTVLLIHGARVLLLVGAGRIAADHSSHHTVATLEFHESPPPQAEVVPP